jgi:hypothetical protein
MIEAGGRLTDAVIDERVRSMASEDPQRFVELREQADRLGLSFRDLARAKAGDGEAAAALMAQVDALSGTIENADDANRVWADGTGAASLELLGLKRELETTSAAYGLATEATSAAQAATRAAGEEAAGAREEWDELRTSLREPAVARITVDEPSPGDLAAIRARIARGIGNIVVPVTGFTPRPIGGQRART